MNEMVWVQKDNKQTRVLQTHKAQYIKAGWKEIKEPKREITDSIVQGVIEHGDNKLANKSRGTTPADIVIDAEARVATELRQPAPTDYNDGLIKPKEKLNQMSEEILEYSVNDNQVNNSGDITTTSDEVLDAETGEPIKSKDTSKVRNKKGKEE